MDQWPDFKSVDWEDLYPRLLFATLGRLRRLRRSETEAHDFVQTAIDKAMNRQRSWDSTRSLYENLLQIISSEVNHAVMSYEGKNISSIDETVVNISDYRENPEDTAIYRSQVDHFLSYLRSQDADVAAVASLILTLGIAESIELGVHLKRPAHEIDNIKRRLGRHCKKYQQEQEPNTSSPQPKAPPLPGELT